jgi:hypothetical protein
MVLLRGAGIELRFGSGEGHGNQGKVQVQGERNHGKGSGKSQGDGNHDSDGKGNSDGEDGMGVAILHQPGDLVEFDGAISTQCELLQGPCVDLNLMVSKSVRADARVERVRLPVAVTASGGECTLVFCIGDSVRLALDTGEVHALGQWDLAVLTQCGVSLSSLESGSSPEGTLVFFATLDGV